MTDKNVLLVNDREHATLLNALRFWQAAGHPIYPEYFDEIPDGPVVDDALDSFIERINTDVTLSVLLTIESGIVTNAYLPGATETICINVFDMDTDGMDEEDLEELMLPVLGIQSGSAYSVGRNIAAPEFMELLDRKWEDQSVINSGDLDSLAEDLHQTDMFLSLDEVGADELPIETPVLSEN